MINRKNSPIKSALISLFVILFVFWYLSGSMTGERVTIVQASPNKIVIQDRDNNTKIININIDISKMITIDEKYDIQYKKRFWQRPRLISIKPIN